MKTLEQEAEYYAHNYFDMHETNNYKALKQGFTAGATSKYVKAEKLRFAIEQLQNIHKEYSVNVSISHVCIENIKDLEQQLKELES